MLRAALLPSLSSFPGHLQTPSLKWEFWAGTNRAARCGCGWRLHFHALATVGADFGIPRVGLAAKKTAGYDCARDFHKLFSLAPVKKVERKKNDQEEEDADGPEEALHESVPVLLGVKENPEGHDQRNHENDKKGTHPGFSPKAAISAQLSAVSK